MINERELTDCQVFPISNVSAHIMKIILDYCYTGVAHITQENAQEFFIAADYFDVSAITQACCQDMEEQLCLSNCIAIWSITNKYYYPQLQKQVYFLKHFEEVVTSSEQFLHLSRENLCSVIDDDQLNMKEETAVFEVVLRWVAHAPLERNKHLASLLPKVRLALVNPDYFLQCIHNNLLQDRNCKAVLMNTMKLMLHVRARWSNAFLFHIHLACPRLPRAFLMAIGGLRWEHSNITEVYDNHAELWVSMAHEQNSRIYHSTVFLNGSVYQIGWFDGHQPLKTTHKQDLVNHMWQEVGPMHSRRSHVSVALLDGLIYAMGGYNGEARLGTAKRYSPETNRWTMISPVNEQRSDASSMAFRGKIYICGGNNGEHCLLTAESYNPLTNQWSMITPMNSMRCGLGVIAYANEIYAVGGFSLSSHLSPAEAYNPSTNTWRPLLDMLTKRSHFGIGVVDDQLWLRRLHQH